MPSAWLELIIPITRYSGRFTVVTHVATGILVVAELNYFIKSKWRIQKAKAILVVLMFIAFMYMDTYPSFKNRNLSSINSADIPSAYRYLKQNAPGPYIEIPLYEDKFPFPSIFFQYFTEQPVLHSLLVNKSKADLIVALHKDTPNYCSKQTGRWMYSLEFRYVVVHEDLMPINYSRQIMEQCGYELVFYPDPGFESSARAYKNYQTAVVYKITPKLQIAGFALVGPHFLLVDWSNRSEPIYSSQTQRSRIEFISLGMNKKRTLSLQSNQVLKAFCGNDESLEIDVDPTPNGYIMKIPDLCTGIILERTSSTELRISGLLLSN